MKTVTLENLRKKRKKQKNLTILNSNYINLRKWDLNFRLEKTDIYSF